MPSLTVGLLTRLFRIEAIANPGVGEKVAWCGRIGFDLLSQLTDENPQVFGLPGVISTPDRAEQRTMSQNFSGIADEINHQIEFFRRQAQLVSGLSDCVGFKIETKMPGFDGLRSGGAGGLATQGRTNPREQLVHTERLGYVIVGPGI